MQPEIMSIIYVFFWLLFGVNHALTSLHQIMTPHEHMDIFGTDETPEYELISITISELHKRRADSASQKTFSMRVFNESIALSCIENDGILAGKNTPIYIIRNVADELQIKKTGRVGAMAFYENVSEAATFTVCNLKNRQQITGVIGAKRLAIRSLPEHIVHKMMKHRRSSENITEDIINRDRYYLAIKIPESSIVMGNYNERTKRDNVESAQTIYPEVLVIVNYWLYKKLAGQLVRYVLSFWHAVDLMFRNLVGPEIRVNIAGIVIAMDQYGIDYIYSKEIAEENNVWGLETGASLKDMRKWLYKYKTNISIDSYDAAFTMTSNKLYGWGHDLINGLSYETGACKVHASSMITSKVAIIKNNGAFDRITSAAHELGHLLGAAHDDDDGECNDSTLMMTAHGGDRNSSVWSKCSLKAFEKYLGSDSANCLRNKPTPGVILPIDLPGTIMSADEQCKKLGFARHCSKKEKICVQLSCVSKTNQRNKCRRTKTAAATGTPCDEGKICFQMQCVDKNGLK